MATADFKIQTGEMEIASGATSKQLLVSASDYDAPASLSKAFFRCVSTRNCSGGSTDGSQGSGNAPEHTACWVDDQSTLLTSITVKRNVSIAKAIKIYWEIWEYIGQDGGANEMKVLMDEVITFGATDTTKTSSASIGESDIGDVVCMITGNGGTAGAASEYDKTLCTIKHDGGSPQKIILERGDNGSEGPIVSVVALEFTGSNWEVNQHQITGSGESASTSSGTHIQDRSWLTNSWRVAAGQMDEIGGEVFTGNDFNVNWKRASSATAAVVVETYLVTTNNVDADTRLFTEEKTDNWTSGADDDTKLINPTFTARDVSEMSVLISGWSTTTGTAAPHGFVAARITGTNEYKLYRGEGGNEVNTRAQIIQWPRSADVGGVTKDPIMGPGIIPFLR